MGQLGPQQCRLDQTKASLWNDGVQFLDRGLEAMGKGGSQLLELVNGEKVLAVLKGGIGQHHVDLEDRCDEGFIKLDQGMPQLLDLWVLPFPLWGCWSQIRICLGSGCQLHDWEKEGIPKELRFSIKCDLEMWDNPHMLGKVVHQL